MWCSVSLYLVVSTTAIDCLERLVSEMACYVLSGTLNPKHSLPITYLWQQSSRQCRTRPNHHHGNDGHHKQVRPPSLSPTVPADTVAIVTAFTPTAYF